MSKDRTHTYTTEALENLLALLDTGPVIVTGYDVSVRNGERTITVHFTDAATESERNIQIKL